MKKLPLLTNRSIRVVGKSIKLLERERKQAAWAAADFRWGNEMQVKYNTILRDEEDLDRANLTTKADLMRMDEIYEEELLARA